MVFLETSGVNERLAVLSDEVEASLVITTLHLSPSFPSSFPALPNPGGPGIALLVMCWHLRSASEGFLLETHQGNTVSESFPMH